MEQPARVSFRRDVIPSFSQAGCNTGACHGTPTGKGGFRLSLRGYLPDQDFSILSHEVAGRRINPMAPETSLILRKPLGQIPHEGGLRLDPQTRRPSNSCTTGSRKGPRTTRRAPAAVRLEIFPETRVLIAPATTQQVAVLVHGADKTVRDVTPICYYDSSNPTIAEVDHRRLRSVQDAGRGRDHRPLPEPRGQHPADPSGRGARVRGGGAFPRTT